METTSKILVIGGNVGYPTHDGPSRHMDERYKALSRFTGAVDIVTAGAFVQYRNGIQHHFEQTTAPRHLPRWQLGLKTLFKQSDYLYEMLFAPENIRRFVRFASNPAYQAIVFSPLQALALLKNYPNNLQQPGRLFIVETHEDLFQWYQKVLNRPNPAMKMVAISSVRWLDQLLNKNQHSAIFLHVSEHDKTSYERRFPGMEGRSHLVPLGINARKTGPYEINREKIRLFYIGGMGVQMNIDAIMHFGEKYYPALANEFGKKLEVMIAGRSPAENAIEYCKTMGWQLHPNLSDDELDQAYLSSTFSLLPFEYAWGAKNKLLESLAYGVPFLATRLMLQQVPDPQAVHPCLFSDSPEEWVAHLKEFHQPAKLKPFRKPLIDYASQHSWESNARLVYELIQEHTNPSTM